MKISYFLSSILITLLYNSCKKEPKSCVGFVPYPQMVKDYLLFKDSSYWIYQDSASGVIDSFWVSNNVSTNKDWPYKITGTKNTPCYENFGYRLNNMLNEKYEDIIFQSIAKSNDKIEKYGHRFEVIFRLTKNNNYIEEEYRFNIKGYDSFSKYNSFGIGIIGKRKSMEIKNIEFNDILFVEYNPSNSNDWVKRIYYSKNIGCIKFEDENGKVWDLIRYNVKK